MNIEIIAIGDEVLGGFCTNTNASFISQELFSIGLLPERHLVVGDNPQDIKKAIHDALLRGSCVITTGGLGPTCDDNTRKVIGELFEVRLEKRNHLTQALVDTFGKHPTIDDQSIVPESAKILKNSIGTASGFVMQDKSKFKDALVISLPGVPHEMKAMFHEEALPIIKELFSTKNHIVFKILHFASLKEHMIDPFLREIKDKFPEVECGIYPGYSVVTVHLKTSSLQAHAEKLKLAEQLLRNTFAKNLFESESAKLSQAVHTLLLAKGYTVSTAESCTGGGLAYLFVQNPGASEYFKGSIVAYTNEMKEKQLRVSSELIKLKGAVSEEVTASMAENVARVFASDISIGVSGVFGPTGGTGDTPVGTVAASIKLPGKPTYSWTMHHRGNRSLIHEKTVQEILATLLIQIRSL